MSFIGDYKRVPEAPDKLERLKQLQEEVRNRIPCTDYLEKAKHGGYCCPFCGSGKHGGGTGALRYYPATNTWVCYACPKKANDKHNKGDVIDLIKEYYGLSTWAEAVEKGAELAGIREGTEIPTVPKIKRPIVTLSDEQKAAALEQKKTAVGKYLAECRERLFEIKQVQNDDGTTAEEYVNLDALGYLGERGISPETAMECGIGFDRNADPAEGGHYAPRIIIPTGEAAYTGRRIDGIKDFDKVYNKDGKPGLFNRDALYSGARCVFITEGAFDAMSCEELEHAAIALNGNGNGDKLLAQLEKEPAKEVSFIVAFDNDSKPDTAQKTNDYADKLVIDLKQAGYNAIRYNISGTHKDANEALCDNAETFQAALAAAETEVLRDELTDFYNAITTEAYKPIPTGLGFFDTLLGGGVVQQQLILLMAAPGAGKTTLAQQVAEELAAHQKDVIYLNFEMSREQMLAKALSARMAKKACKMSINEILQGYAWTDAQRQAVQTELDAYRKTSNRYIRYNPDKVTTDLDSILNYMDSVGEACRKQGKPAPALVVDYLQYIRTKQKMETQELIKAIVTGLKDYARKYNTFVICISATNRTSNASGKITMESGRDSSNIEYTADCELSLNYFDVDNKTVSPDDTEALAALQGEKWRRMIIRVLKGRFIVPGRKSRVYFNAEYNRFYGEYEPMPIDGERKAFPVDRATMETARRR